MLTLLIEHIESYNFWIIFALFTIVNLLLTTLIFFSESKKRLHRKSHQGKSKSVKASPAENFWLVMRPLF